VDGFRYAQVVNIVDELHAVTAALRAAAIPYAVCGGIAVTAHGATRTTKDIDILIERSQIGAALTAVAAIGYTIPAQPMTFEEGTPRERHVQRVTKIAGPDHLVIDFLIAEAGLAGTMDDRIDVSLPRGTVTFVARETLLRMKRMAGRPIDLADIEKLEHDDGT
jgi:hypothetical protein